MAKKKQSTFEYLIEIASKLPWWVGLLFAVAFYLLLHWYATLEAPKAENMQHISKSFSGSLMRSFAMFGQYVLPLIFTLGACTSALKQFSRAKLHKKVAGNPAPDILDDMSWQEFEVLVGESFRIKGYQVEEVGGGGADNGIDLILKKNDEKYLVQCKQWKTYKVGVKPVRELLGVMVGESAAGGIFVTSGEFTKDAIAFAKANNIKLIDGVELHSMIRSAQQTVPLGAKDSRSAVTKDPICPKCRSTMVKRIAKKGAKAGEQFWGCSRFPVCRSTLPISG